MEDSPLDTNDNVAVDFPGPTLYDRQGTARVYIDENVTDAQRQAFESIFQGKRGGLMSILTGLMTSWLPSQYPKFEVHKNGPSDGDPG